MANPEATLLCFITFLILVSSSSSSARLLGGHDPLLPQRLEAADGTEPAVALKLPGENPAGSASERSQRVNLPCVMGVGAALNKPETLGRRFQPLRLVGGGAGRTRFGPLVLNMLPKGSVPPSGPSKRINGDNN